MEKVRYLSVSDFYKGKFFHKIMKVTVDAGFSCPNRDGKLSYDGCIFCSEVGSGDFCIRNESSVSGQFYNYLQKYHSKWKDSKYIIYFQPFTNTYGEIDKLKKAYYEALSLDDVVGLSIATRPDCFDDKIFELLDDLNKRTYLQVELGLQTIHDETASIINRGYQLPVFESALSRLAGLGIDVVVHVIIGLPGENGEKILQTVKYLAALNVNGIKLQLLHVLKNTKLQKMYESGKIRLISKDEYIKIVAECISYLPENTVIHRITGDPPRALLVAPDWATDKWGIINGINSYMRSNDLYQGKNFKRGEFL